ncbi:MAG TPA: glycosyltransferase, partial [Flavisolibacter sp.]|nr:glycosyltransferase [Flavisolibacter sp.]
ELSLFGSGPHDKYLQELVIFYGLEKKVFLRGHVDNLTDVWAQHHLLVLPSHSEGTPLALLEAAFCSRAAVVTDVGGNAEVVKDGVSGFIASASSVKALDEALERAWSNRENLFQMGLEARKVVEQDIGYNNFDSIVEEILNA